jgi:putative FmdB family regulatory protein
VPIYEYVCASCQHRFEVKQKVSDPPLSSCVRCGQAVTKVISAPAIMFKGSGWYVTDYSDKLKQPGQQTEPAGQSSNGQKESGGQKDAAASPAQTASLASSGSGSASSSGTSTTSPSTGQSSSTTAGSPTTGSS